MADRNAVPSRLGARLRGILGRFFNWAIGPLHTHCSGCDEKLPEPSRGGLCQTCRIW
jgi:hypothetical protein